MQQDKKEIEKFIKGFVLKTPQVIIQSRMGEKIQSSGICAAVSNSSNWVGDRYAVLKMWFFSLLNNYSWRSYVSLPRNILAGCRRELQQVVSWKSDQNRTIIIAHILLKVRSRSSGLFVRSVQWLKLRFSCIFSFKRLKLEIPCLQ